MISKPSLVFVSTRFLFPADSGGKIRTTQVLRGLKGGAFRIILLMPADETSISRYSVQIEEVCDELLTWNQAELSPLTSLVRKIRLFSHRNPIPVMTDWNANGAAVVSASLHQHPELVVFDFPHSAVLAPPIISVPSVMFTHNIEAEIFERHWKVSKNPVQKFVWKNQYRKMSEFERATFRRFDTIIAVSQRDCEFFRRDYAVTHCDVISTGVDTEFFTYSAPGQDPKVVFCGSMDWMANIDGIEYFADHVWPIVRELAPKATMKVVGRSPPDRLVTRIKSTAPEWEFTGFVDDVRGHISGAAAFVIPLRVGGGTRIKAFEAMALGVPVVSTSIGVEGLSVTNGEHYLAAENPEEFASELLRLIDSPNLRAKLSERARRLVENNYGYRRAANEFEQICLHTLQRSRKESVAASVKG